MNYNTTFEKFIEPAAEHLKLYKKSYAASIIYISFVCILSFFIGPIIIPFAIAFIAIPFLVDYFILKPINEYRNKIKNKENKDYQERLQEDAKTIAEYEEIIAVLEEQSFLSDQTFDQLMSLPIQQSEKQKIIARSYDHIRYSQNNMQLPSIDESDIDLREDLTAKHQEAITRGRIFAEGEIRSNKEKKAESEKILKTFLASQKKLSM